MDNERIARYVEARVGRLHALLTVLTHGDLDWSN